MAGLYSKFKSALGIEYQADSGPLALEASKVSADFRKVIGVGSLGVVYTGRFMEDKCAVKVFNIGVIQRDVVQNYDIASIIQHHPNVVLVHGLWYGNPINGLPNNDPALVMELCTMSLDAYIKERVDKGEVALFRLEKRLEILNGVTSGMIYLHSKRIIHGDLSAKKVLLSFLGLSNDKTILAKVAGVCQMKLFTPDTMLRHQTSVQRSGIMPPEVKDGGEDVELTEAVDLFSFGCLIAHVASCIYPVPNTKASLNEFQKRAQFITGHHAHIYEPMMKRCLDKHPAARGTFEDVKKDLSVHQSKYGGKQAQKLEDQIIRSWSSRTSSRGARSRAAAPHDEHNFLPRDSVVIRDRKKSANMMGEGSYAKVFRGEYNGKPCAVKVYKEDVLKKELLPDPGGTGDLEMLLKVQHTNIVQMYGMWLDPHKDRAAPSIVMELCDESLFDFIRRFKGKRVPKIKKLAILQDIARGMVYLHDQNIVHGDLRSSNVLLCHSEDQTVAKIADFDMATFLDTGAQHHFTLRFTEEYLPPEVFDHKEHKDQKKRWARLTPKVDVFCFGELVLEMGCGTYPTPTPKFHERQMLTELQRREKHLGKLKQSDKESLGSIIRKCLADAPEGRPSFTEILLEVDAYLHKYGERPDLEVLQDKTAECEALRAEAMKWEDDAKSLCGMQDELEKELEKERTENQDLQINLQMQQIKVEELQQQIQDISQRERDAAEKSLTMSSRLQDMSQRERDAAEKSLTMSTRLQTKVDEMDVQLKKERQEWTSEHNVLQQQNAELKKKASEMDEQLKRESKKWESKNTALKLEVVTGKEHVKKTTDQLEQAAAARDKMETELQHLREKSDRLEQEHQQTVAKKVEELNSMKREHEREMQALKETHETLNADKEKGLAEKSQDVARLQKELERQRGMFAKERQQFQAQIAAEERAKRAHQETLEEARTAAEKELDKTKKEKDALREDLQATHEVLSMKTNEHAEVMKEVASLREALEQKASNIGELQSKSHDREKLIQQLNRDRLNMQQEVEQLKSQRDTFKQKLDDAQTSLKTSKEHTASVEEQLDRFQKKLNVKQSANAKLLQSLKDKEGEMKEVKQQKAILESSAKGQDDRITQLKTKADEMDVQLKEERQEWTLERSALQQQNAELKKNVSEMDEQLKRESSEWQSEITALKLEVATGKEHAKILVAKLEETQSSMAATTSQLEQAAAARNEMEKELQHLREKCDHLEQEHQETLAKKVEDLNSMKRESEREIQTLKQTHETLIATKEKSLTEKSQDVVRLQEKLHRAEDVRVKLLVEKEDQKKREAALHDTVKELEQQHSNLMRQLSEREDQRDSLQREKADLLHRNHQLAVDKENVLKEKEEDLKQYRDVERKLHRLSGNHAKKMAESEKEMQRLKDQLEEARKKQLTVQAQEQEAPEEQHMDKEVTRLQEEISQLKEQLKALKEGKEQAKRHSEDLRLQNTELQKELEETVKTFETTVGALQGELKDTAEHSKTCESERDHLRDEKRVWVKREADLEDSVKKLKETCTDMEQSRMELHAQLKELKAENGAAKTQQKADSKKTSNLQVALQAEKDKSCDAEETMRQKEKEVKKYKADLQAERDKVHIMEVAALQKDRDLDQCRDKLAEAQRKELDLNDQLRLYRNQLEATKVALQVEKDKLHSKEESVCQKEKEVKKLKGDLQSERDKVQTMEEAALQKERELDQCKARKAAVEKDLVRARKMAKDLLDERVVVNAESEQKRENLNERLMEFKQQAVLSEERLKQVQGLEGEHLDLKVQLKTLMTTLEDFQKVLTDEQKSRKSLDASVKALTAEIDQLRTELKERDNEVSSLAAANKHLQRKVDAADANSGEMKAELTQLRTELKERDNKVSSLTAANGGLQRKVDAADADITEMKAKSTSLKKQVKSLTNDKKSLKQTLDAAKAAIQKHKNDYEDCQEKLREAEQQVALFQGKRQQLEVLEGVAVELKSRLSDLMMDAPPLPTPSVSGGKDGASAVALTQEAAQKVQLLESERDSLKAERHMYQMKWLAAEDMMEAVKNDRQSLEESLELSRLALRGAKVHVQVTEQSLREEYKRKNSEAYEVIKRLQHPQEGCAEYPSEKTKISALVDLCKYFRDENMETLERAAEEKQKMLVSMKEADERVKEMTSTIAALKECIQVQDAEVRDLQAQLAPRQGMAVIPVPPPSDVADLTGDEVVLEQLCYMAIGIKQLLISPDGGTFTLGNGDASLEFPPGAVQKDIHIRYAIILHGPFVFPAGFKPGSVVVYINMDGATLVKPVQLLLSHWCIREETDDEETMKFVRAPHSLESGKKEYAFEELEDEADFTTRTNVGVLTIQEPQCLFCVKSKREKVARYCAMTFFRYDSSEETLLFRIQLSCDSLDWIEELASVLDRRGWQHSSASRDIVPRFCFSARQIAASPPVSRGPGWNAMIEGAHNVKEADFLMPIGKSKAALKREVNSGCFPPYICYQILYSLPEERRVMPTFLKVDLDGADVPLTFSCRFYQAENPASPVSPAFFSSATSPHTPGRMAASYGPSPATSGHIPSAERHPSSRQAEISQPAATAVPDAVTDGPSATTPPTETAADILDHFRDQFINDAASSDIMYELKHKDVISSGDVEMIERKAGVTQQNQYLHKCLTGKCTKEALMEVCNVMEAVKGNPRINALGKDMRRRVKASYGPSPATSGPIPSAERHPSSPQAETSKTADPTSPVSPAFFSSATSPRTPGRMTASYGPSPATSGHIPSAERHPSSPQAEISKPTEVIEALNHDLDAQWREFGTHLCVKPSSMDIIDKNNKSDAGACMLQLVEKWLVQENGTGDLPRTWVTVVQAVKKTGKGRLAEELAQRYGVQLPGQ